MPRDLQSLAVFQEETDFYRIHLYDVIGSTNDILYRFAEDGHPEGTVIVANAQEQGRGRLGRSWFSPPGVNIYLSILLRPKAFGFQPTLITISASLAVVEAIRGLEKPKFEIKDSKFYNVWSKWPNDIYFADKKLGGILTTASLRGVEGSFFVIGIGVNVNMRREDIPQDIRDNATSLYIEGGDVTDRGRLIASMLKSFQVYYIQLNKEPDTIVSSWCGISKTINSRVRAITQRGEIHGIATGIDERGFLRVIQDSGEEIMLNSAEVVHLR